MAADVKVWVFAVVHDEAPMLGYFLRHYLPLAERVTLFDDHSTDGGPELAMGHARVTVRPYSGSGLDDGEFVEFAAEAYREARGRADFVIWADADEFIYHPDLPGRLARYRANGVTLPRVEGWAMFANAFPTTEGQIYDEVHCGARAAFYDKPVVFDPTLDLRWIPGKHALAGPVEAERGGPAELKLLHFRHLGARYFEQRNARNYARMTPQNIARRLGYQTYPEEQAAHGWAAQVKAMELELQVVV